jgi:CheY-like chemotaxis protein
MFRVLVVDDDPGLRAMLAEVLIGEGYEVARACHGEEAVAYLEQQWQPDVMLLDMLMPIMDGAEVCHWLSGHIPAMERPHVVVLSASLTPNMHVPVVDALLAKPFNLDTVLEMVSRFCGELPLHQRYDAVMPNRAAALSPNVMARVASSSPAGLV